jgi:hypothetical protein
MFSKVKEPLVVTDQFEVFMDELVSTLFLGESVVANEWITARHTQDRESDSE